MQQILISVSSTVSSQPPSSSRLLPMPLSFHNIHKSPVSVKQQQYQQHMQQLQSQQGGTSTLTQQECMKIKRSRGVKSVNTATTLDTLDCDDSSAMTSSRPTHRGSSNLTQGTHSFSQFGEDSDNLQDLLENFPLTNQIVHSRIQQSHFKLQQQQMQLQQQKQQIQSQRKFRFPQATLTRIRAKSTLQQEENLYSTTSKSANLLVEKECKYPTFLPNRMQINSQKSFRINPSSMRSRSNTTASNALSPIEINPQSQLPQVQSPTTSKVQSSVVSTVNLLENNILYNSSRNMPSEIKKKHKEMREQIIALFDGNNNNNSSTSNTSPSSRNSSSRTSNSNSSDDDEIRTSGITHLMSSEKRKQVLEREEREKIERELESNNKRTTESYHKYINLFNVFPKQFKRESNLQIDMNATTTQEFSYVPNSATRQRFLSHSKKSKKSTNNNNNNNNINTQEHFTSYQIYDSSEKYFMARQNYSFSHVSPSKRIQIHTAAKASKLRPIIVSQ